VFDSAGKFLESIGKKGTGPNEFEGRLALYVGPGDSLFAFDARTRRVTVFSPDLRPRRSQPFQLYPGDGVAWGTDGSLIVSGLATTSPQGIDPFHVVSDGKINRSFGSNRQPFVPTKAYEHQQLIAPAMGGGFWAAARWRYELSRWTFQGDRTQVLTGKPDWYRNEFQGRVPSPDGPEPSPYLTAMWQDSSGYLWLVFNVADSNWKSAFSNGRLGPHGREPEMFRLFDTMIEVLDPRTSSRVATLRHDGYIRGRSGQYLFSEAADSDGAESILFWRARLVGLGNN
jgi:hypothetical protein